MLEDSYIRCDDVNKCWYKEICDLYGTDGCRYTCKKFTQTDYLFQLSGLPRSKWKPMKLSMDMLNPDVSEILSVILADCEYFVKSGFNLYLWGDTGCGKTSWAVKIMNGYFAYVAEKNDFRPRGRYVSVPSFLRDAKMYMVNKSENFMDELRIIKECDIVIWDDIGQTDSTNFESQWIYSYVNERLFANKCNIFTSNLSPKELDESNKRLASRICKGADCLNITGPDLRCMNTYTYFMNNCEEVDEVGSGTDDQ